MPLWERANTNTRKHEPLSYNGGHWYLKWRMSLPRTAMKWCSRHTYTCTGYSQGCRYEARVNCLSWGIQEKVSCFSSYCTDVNTSSWWTTLCFFSPGYLCHRFITSALGVETHLRCLDTVTGNKMLALKFPMLPPGKGLPSLSPLRTYNMWHNPVTE